MPMLPTTGYIGGKLVLDPDNWFGCVDLFVPFQLRSTHHPSQPLMSVTVIAGNVQLKNSSELCVDCWYQHVCVCCSPPLSDVAKHGQCALVPRGMFQVRMDTTGVIFCHKSGAVPLISLTDMMFLKGSNSLTTKASNVMEEKQGIFIAQNFDKSEI